MTSILLADLECDGMHRGLKSEKKVQFIGEPRSVYIIKGVVFKKEFGERSNRTKYRAIHYYFSEKVSRKKNIAKKKAIMILDKLSQVQVTIQKVYISADIRGYFLILNNHIILKLVFFLNS